jgi:hypothetical protein
VNAVRSQEQIDADLEADIDAACNRMVTGITEEARRDGWTEMAILLRRRSDVQIMKMELERRLARKPK